MTPLVLASTSIYRKELISKLGIAFTCQAPFCDEDVFKDKIPDPQKLAETLAWEKAKSLATPDNCVIGGDQVVELNGEILGKTGSVEKSCEQLMKMQGKTHKVITAVNVIFKGKAHPLLDMTVMKMRSLTAQQIKTYVETDLPTDCAGSYKIEKSGLVLFESVTCKDFTAIQGVPLIQLTSLMLQLGFSILKQENK